MGPLQDGNRMTGSLFDWPVVAREAPEVAPPSVPTMAPTMKLPPAPLPPDVESSGRHGEPWGGLTPRLWQADALPRLLSAFSRVELLDADPASNGICDPVSLPSSHAGVVYACTGSGKSVMLCEVVAHRVVNLGVRDTLLVTVPTIALVEQLIVDLRRRLDTVTTAAGFKPSVGAYYTGASEWSRSVVVTCHPSMRAMVADCRKGNRRIVEWVADECHRTDAETVLLAWQDMTDAWGTVPRVGFSATPYLSDPDKGLRLWRHLLYRYTPDDAIRDGALVPWRRHGFTPAQAARYETARARYRSGEADDRHMDAALDDACIEWVLRQSRAGGAGVVSATSIADAEAFARDLSDALAAASLAPAYAVHSKQPAAVLAARREALRTGRASALVHVNMLSEGVDMPFLRWGALRRGRARVGFVQEVGRFLRVSAGKVAADIWDPLDLFSEHGLTHPAALADLPNREGVEERDAEGKPIEMMELVDPLTGRTYRVPLDPRLQTPEQTVALAHSAGGAYIGDVASCLRAAGLLPSKVYAPGRWRNDPASDRQVEVMAKAGKAMRAITRAGKHGRAISAAYRMIMSEHESAVEAGKRTPIRKGAVSDFLDVLGAVRVTYDAGSDRWDTTRQDRSFAALDGVVDADAVLTAAETIAAARRKVTR